MSQHPLGYSTKMLTPADVRATGQDSGIDAALAHVRRLTAASRRDSYGRLIPASRRKNHDSEHVLESREVGFTNDQRPAAPARKPARPARPQATRSREDILGEMAELVQGMDAADEQAVVEVLRELCGLAEELAAGDVESSGSVTPEVRAFGLMIARAYARELASPSRGELIASMVRQALRRR